jgi:RecA/RadA recombinase
LDRITLGGLHTGAVTHVYGKAAAGKTTLALQFVSSSLRLGFDTIYINTEASSPVSRLEQMTGRTYAELEGQVKILAPKGFQEQGVLIDDLELYAREEVRAVVIDTLARYYRLTLDDRKTNYANHRELNRQAGVLKGLAKNRDLAVVILNQVTSRPEGGEEFEPVARNILSYWSDYTLEIRDTGRTGERHIVRVHPEGRPNEGRLYLCGKGLSQERPDRKE